MSQLYQLFCEGLKSRKEELTSTFIVATSTPLEEEDHGSSTENHATDQNSAAQQQAQAAADVHRSVNSSLEPQVGSAEPESPTDHVSPSPEPAALHGIPKNLQQETSRHPKSFVQQEPERGENDTPSPQSAAMPGISKKQEKNLKCQSSYTQAENESLKRKEKDRNNVSSVDFVDRIIAIKRRDEALSRKRRNEASISDSSDESELQNKGPISKLRKNNNKVSDSSETDFEGAEEYYKKHPSHMVAKENVPCRLSSDDESSMRLVIQHVSTGSSSQSILSNSQSSSELCVESPPAARCRVFLFKKGNQTSKSPDCQPDHPSQEKQLEKNNMKTVRVVLTRLSCSNLEDQQQRNKDYSAQQTGSVSALCAGILRGIVAFVEYRSGHDNRSMGIRTQLRSLGATVVEKFNKSVTHVVFNEGSPSTLQRARNQGCHLVSVLWIDDCKKLGRVAPEDNHPPFNLHLYDQPHFLSKYRKMKSLQPDFEEGKSEERLNKYIKKIRQKKQPAVLSKTDKNLLTDEKSCSSNDEEAPASNEKHRFDKKMSDGVVLRPLSIVLNKIDAGNYSAASSNSVSSEKRNKRRLMPLQRQTSVPLSLEDFDPAERLRPECPYIKTSSSKQKQVLPLRKSPKQGPSPSQSQRSLGRSEKPLSSTSHHRRSSCFVRRREGVVGSQYQQKKTKIQMRTMVCTFMHRRDIDVVAAVLKQLGGWILEPTVSPKTTHVVCGDEKRTINLLRGIAHGCWILHQEWVMRSLEAGHWLDEEPFELTVYPAIQRCRVARETLGVPPDIFSTIGNIFVAKDTTPPRSDILDLLELCGGHIVKTARQAKIIIGKYQRRASHTDVFHVNEQWVLDSIQENMLRPVRNYQL